MLLPLSIIVNAVVLFFCLTLPARAGYGEGDPRLERLYASYISPCCWRENLGAHNSPDATRLRSRIAGMVKDGQTEEQIQQTLVAEYGKRIMSLPEGGTRVWLFWTPTTLLCVGAAIVIWVLRRMKQSPGQPAFHGAPAELPPGWDDQ